FSTSTPCGTFTIGFGPSRKRRQSLYSVEDGVGPLMLLARVWLVLAGVGQCPYWISTALGISTLSGAPLSAGGTDISGCPAWLNTVCRRSRFRVISKVWRPVTTNLGGSFRSL